jgi:hypothetical protein
MMTWLQNNHMNPSDLDDPTLLALATLAGIPFVANSIAPGKRGPIVDQAIEWLRNNNVNPADINEPSLPLFSRHSGARMPQLNIPKKEKQKKVDEIVEWFRSNDVSPDVLDDATVFALADLAGLPFTVEVWANHYLRRKMTLSRQCLNWIGNIENPSILTL